MFWARDSSSSPSSSTHPLPPQPSLPCSLLLPGAVIPPHGGPCKKSARKHMLIIMTDIYFCASTGHLWPLGLIKIKTSGGGS